MNKTKRLLFGLSLFLFSLLVDLIVNIFQWQHWSGGWYTIGEGVMVCSGLLAVGAFRVTWRLFWQMIDEHKMNMDK